ncbi:MAG: MASE3 domain-containing protein [Chloroflexota bacterium]
MASLLLLAAALHNHIYFVLETHHLLVVHNLLELGGILIGFSVFVVNWESSKQTRNVFNLFIGTGFVAIIGIDLLHLLSQEGMPDVLTANSTNKALYYRLLARLWTIWVMWKAANLKPNRLDPYLDRSYLLSQNLAVCVIAFAVITLLGNQLPPIYDSEQGSTWFSVTLQAIVVALYLATSMVYLKRSRITRDSSMLLIMAALVAIAVSEASLILFLSPGDLYLIIGHIYKVAAYYLIFKVLTVTSVHKPYEQLKIAKDRLEQAVVSLDARNRELDALDEVAVALGATIKPEEVLETAIDRIMQVMGADAGAVFLLEENGDELKLVTWRGLPGEVIEDCASHRLCHYRTCTSHEPGDAGEDSMGESRVMVRRIGGSEAVIAPLRACICAPIVSKGQLLGSIAMVAKYGMQFSKKDTNLLTAIAYQFGLAIENARLYEQTDERLREKILELQKAERRSRFLYEVGDLFACDMDLTQVLSLVAAKSVEVLGDCCEILLLDEQSNMLRTEAIYCKEKRELALVKSICGSNPIPIGESVVGLVAQTGEPILQSVVKREEFIAEIRSRANIPDKVTYLKMKIPTSRVIVPIRALGRILGVMMVYSTSIKHHLGDADLSLMAELAGRVGVAIENRRLFQESQSQRTRLEAIISQMVDGVVVADKSGKPLVVNASAERMLTDRGKTLIGDDDPVDNDTKISDDRRPARKGHSLIERALAGELVTGEEVFGVGVKGDCILSASASPIRDETGNITGAVVVLRDVTAEREVERMKDEFVATTSHELRTPITAVMGYTDLLLRGIQGPLTPRQRGALESIKSASSRLLRLINDLLDMSRLEAGRHEVVLAPVNFAEIAEKVVSDTAMLAESKRITIKNGVRRDLPLVLADEEQLQRILGNLLSNAIKFTDPGGKVSLNAHVGSGKVKPARNQRHQAKAGEMAVTVTDTGIGIPPEYQDKVWDKFRQVDSSTRRLFGGTGLGLAIAKRLVQLHGGDVWVESEGVPGKGSIFGFTLRLAENEPPSL